MPTMMLDVELASLDRCEGCTALLVHDEYSLCRATSNLVQREVTLNSTIIHDFSHPRPAWCPLEYPEP